MFDHREAFSAASTRLPTWVPSQVKTYLAHTEGGASLRHIARKSGCHASTVMRQVRRTETLREDPLADSALSSLETFLRSAGMARAEREETLMTMARTDQEQERLNRDILRALKALSDPKALLVIADGVEDAVVVVNTDEDRPVRRAVVSRAVAEMLALQEWIDGRSKGRLGRYKITGAGRTELSRRIAATESARVQVTDDTRKTRTTQGTGQKRTAGAEPPLTVLARRKRTGGEPFLPPELVRAAERFKESYEIARAAGMLGDDLDDLLLDRLAAPKRVAQGSSAEAIPRGALALEHLTKAVRCLGPELSRTVILAVCRETGMETIEKQLDYPARSGKIVLRIALNSLARHYDETGDAGHGMIY
ncbi:MAG TPA: helix-turn-helix domain containing protein [Maritimibacter sp.]|nr:helix-turn-helix domain containing protein [Maritimibacter sp.]